MKKNSEMFKRDIFSRKDCSSEESKRILSSKFRSTGTSMKGRGLSHRIKSSAKFPEMME